MSSSGRFPAEMMMMPETYVALLLVSNRLIQLNRIFRLFTLGNFRKKQLDFYENPSH